MIFLGGYANVRDILFEDCAIERSSYVPPADVDAYARGVGNTISINEFGHLPDGGHVEGITFRDCHLGASNGTATGALRMMMEAFTWSDQQAHPPRLARSHVRRLHDRGQRHHRPGLRGRTPRGYGSDTRRTAS